MKRGLLIGTLLLALAGCGGGDGGNSAPNAERAESSPTATEAPESPTQAPEDELEQAYRTYIAAFLTGDGATAYGLLSKRCQEAEPLSSFAQASEAAAELYGEVDYSIESIKVDGDEGTVDATYAVEALNSGAGSLWVYEDGAWRSDKCD